MLDSVVVSYHSVGDLNKFVSSWIEQDYGKLWIVDVDHQEGEPLPDNLNYPDITYLPLDWNAGYSRACNLGASFGNNDIIALFNADVILSPNSLEECCDALTIHNDWGILGPHQLNEKGLVTHAGIFGTNTEPQFRTFHSADNEKYHDVRDDCVTVSGSAYFVKRSVWDELTLCPIYQAANPDINGAFLPTPHYYEETWCSYHARSHGYKIAYLGTTTIIHKWHQATPVGGWAEQQMPISQKMFREMCALHSIDCD